MDRIVVVGAGHAGFQLAASLRTNNYRGEISLLNGEPNRPYQRPPLSKGFLKTGRHDDLYFRNHDFFSGNSIDLIEDSADGIDRGARRLRTATGSTLSYDHLVLATGTVNRILEAPGVGPDVLYIKTLQDAEDLRSLMPRLRRAVVIGGGFIGLEFAAAAAEKGIAVEVVDTADRLMSRTASRLVSRYFEARLRGSGVGLNLNANVVAILRRDDRIEGVALCDGREIPADTIVVGIGALPCQDIAARAGLDVNNGIVVDEYLLTSDSNISAIGDCAAFISPHANGRRIRLECAQNAGDQAKCVAARLTGNPRPYISVPWFWSDQGSDRLQIAGLIDRHDLAVLRGSLEDRSFSVFCFRAGRLVGVESVNRAGDHILARRLLAAGTEFDPMLAADTNFELKTLFTQHLQPI